VDNPPTQQEKTSYNAGMNFGVTDRIKRHATLFATAVATALGPFSARLVQAQQFGFTSVEGFVGGILVALADFIFYIVGWVTSKLGSFLDWSVDRFVLQMATEVDKIDAIDAMWRIFRDLGNIVFIFLILYAAISIILDTNNASAKRTLVSVVVVALFVNFSLFATKVVIDTSNVVALQFYENIAVYETNDQGEYITDNNSTTTDPTEASIDEDVNARLSNVVAAQLNLSSVQDGTVVEEAAGDGSQANYEIALARLGGAVFTGIAGFIFGALAVLIIIRFFVLVLLMIASPLAFVTLALPQAEMGKKWWSWLISQSFFAPAVMGMMYVTIYFSTSFKNSLEVNPGSGGDASLMKAIIEPGSNVDILVFYATTVGMLIASLIIAQRMGAVGADKAVSYGNQAVSWVGNKVQSGGSTLGSGARSMATAPVRYGARSGIGDTGRKLDDKFSETRFGNTLVGKKIRDYTTKKAAEAEFGTGKSAKQVKKDSEERGRDVRDLHTDYTEAEKQELAQMNELQYEAEELQEDIDEAEEELEENDSYQHTEDAISSAKDNLETLEDLEDEISDLNDSLADARHEKTNYRDELIDAEVFEKNRLDLAQDMELSGVRYNDLSSSEEARYKRMINNNPHINGYDPSTGTIDYEDKEAAAEHFAENSETVADDIGIASHKIDIVDDYDGRSAEAVQEDFDDARQEANRIREKVIEKKSEQRNTGTGSVASEQAHLDNLQDQRQTMREDAGIVDMKERRDHRRARAENIEEDVKKQRQERAEEFLQNERERAEATLKSPYLSKKDRGKLANTLADGDLDEVGSDDPDEDIEEKLDELKKVLEDNTDNS
jgi:hypothetical protein